MGPLDGVKVVEMAGLAPGPFGCMILGDLGAQVLQVRWGGTAHAAIVPPEGPLDRGRRTVAKTPGQNNLDAAPLLQG
jgi:alpha-methylacyl-CoA racemase